jgi:NAD(P)-dependent dehydrogenase (short-subunit alcohol dehydrogenase family)
MRTVLITGASSGIGRQAALHFNDLGYLVFAGVRKLEDGQRIASQASAPDQLQPVLLDVTNPEQITAAVLLVTERAGATGLTALISNAGIAALAPPASCEQCPIETQQQVMDINFFGAVRVVQAFLPLLRSAKGTVVFNTALMAHTVIPFNGGYAASKCALEGWADSLRREVQTLGVRVAIIEAGYISSELESKQHLAKAGSDAVYPLEAGLRAAMSKSSATMADRRSASPLRMAEAMAAAAHAANPRPRRTVGAGARLIWALGCLPDRVQDRIFRTAMSRLAQDA